MITLENINFSNNGRTIHYDYNADPACAKFFNANEKLWVTYDEDISNVHLSILIIPFLANIMPIAWFGNFTVKVGEVDSDFLASLKAIRSEMMKHNHGMSSNNDLLKYDSVVTNNLSIGKSAMLFSGGVDAFCTYFRHFQETPELITIQGADIELTDTVQWESVKAFNQNEKILKANQKKYISTNFQKFYTYNVDLLLPNLGWWGNIQHGLALICVVAPLSYVRGYNKIYIASTRSSTMEFNPWGSMPEIDEKISWAGLRVIHDGFELKRQDKVDSIVEAVNKLETETTLRVCYSELKVGLNCSKCEKCIRTIFGIMLAGDNPNKYGFAVDKSIYKLVQGAVSKGFKSRGTQFFWKEIVEKARQSDNIFTFADPEKEVLLRSEALKVVERSCNRDLVQSSASKKFKHILIHKYPKAFKFYLKMRRSI